MTNSYIPYGKHDITDEDIQSVVNILKSNWLTQGPEAQKFEEEINDKVGANYSVVVNSATSALHIACMALDLKKNEFVWTTPITFVATANAARYCKAQIDFIDVELNTGLLDVGKLEVKLEQAKKAKKLPKIVIPVHLAGNSCDMEKIYALSQIYGFKIIEDASHAIGGSYKGESIGTCKYSDITVFSLHPVKIITSGEGGVALTRKKDLAKKMRLLRSHGITKDPRDFVDNNTPSWRYEQQELGYNYRMSDIHAALGRSQLKALDNNIIYRNKIYEWYKANLPKRCNLLKVSTNNRSAMHLAIVLLDNTIAEYHDQIFNNMRKAGIGVNLHYYPVHLQPYYKSIGFKEGDFPLAEEYARRAISLPIYPKLSAHDCKRVIDELERNIEMYF